MLTGPVSVPTSSQLILVPQLATHCERTSSHTSDVATVRHYSDTGLRWHVGRWAPTHVGSAITPRLVVSSAGSGVWLARRRSPCSDARRFPAGCDGTERAICNDPRRTLLATRATPLSNGFHLKEPCGPGCSASVSVSALSIENRDFSRETRPST